MKQQFTKQFMLDNCGCYPKEQLMSCSFMQSEPITLQAILQSEIPLKDKYWFVCYKLATKEENQQIAIRVAELVLPIFEKKYPDDLRPRQAIEAARLYLAGTISRDELIEARSAAYAASAYAAAYASATYAAATAAAYAADAAADVDAAYTADAAAAASTASAGAAIQQQLVDYLIEVCGVKTITL